MRQRYIQPYPPAMVGCLVFDVDRQGAAFAWETGNLPAPSIVATNPANGHAHLFYAVETPVIKTDAARMEPVRFLAAARCHLPNTRRRNPLGGVAASTLCSSSLGWRRSFSPRRLRNPHPPSTRRAPREGASRNSAPKPVCASRDRLSPLR
ncbi:MAG: replication initiation protein [Betaproteobacteria bacterium]|nr:replication initiation protein [Betaproteobacteria bacterium]